MDTRAAEPIWLRTSGWSGRAISFFAGGIGVLGHAPLHLWPLGLLSFAWLFWRLLHTKPAFKSGMNTAFWHGLGYFGVGVFWIGSAFIARGPAFIPLMPPMILALAAVLALFWGVAGGVFVRWQRSGISAVIAFASVFLLAELVRGHLFGGFPWNLPGYIFEAGSRPSQIASFANIYGLSWFVLFLSAALALLLSSTDRVKGGVMAIILLGGCFAYGHVRLSNAELETVPDVKIRLVSIPFSQADKFNPSKSIDIVNQFITASVEPGIEDVTHLVWPEGAVNGLAMDNEGLLFAVGRDLALADDTPPVWLMNSLRVETTPHPRGGAPIDNYYNSSVAVTFDALGNPAVAAYNDKHRLVPFGEFIPGGKWLESYDFPVVSTALASISPAPQKALVDFPGLPRLSAQICYEADFPGLTPIDKDRPAQFILNQTNDAWYGPTWGPAQHANIARYRAIEEGLPLLRSASNGLSAMIDPYGRIYAQVKLNNSSYIDTELLQPIPKKSQTRLVTFFLLLINLLISCIYQFRKRGVRSR